MDIQYTLVSTLDIQLDIQYTLVSDLVYLYSPSRVLICWLCCSGICASAGMESHFRTAYQLKGGTL